MHTLQNMLDIFGALSDNKRLRILKLLEPGELCFSQIAAALELHHGNATLHIKALKKAGLVRERKVGRALYYQTDYSGDYTKFLAEKMLLDLRDAAIDEDRKRLVCFRQDDKQKKAGTEKTTRRSVHDYRAGEHSLDR